MLKFIFLIVVMPLVLIFFVIGCSDNNPVDSEEEHFEATGLFIISGTDTIAKYKDLIVSGNIEVVENDTTDILRINFLQEDGHIGIPPTDDWSLDWLIADGTIAEVVTTDSQLELYQLHIAGKKAGQTTIKIIINHHSHKDYESAEIPIIVNPND
jgi:hypothetical protein